MVDENDARYEAILRLFRDLGIEPTGTNMAQMWVYLHAMAKFVERNAHYKDLWVNGGADDSLHHISSKSARLNMLRGMDWSLSEVQSPLDDALDLMNYSVFFYRHVTSAALTTEDINNLGCEIRERRWPGSPWRCTWTNEGPCPVHGEAS